MSDQPVYTREFRIAAIKLALESKNRSDVARQLGIPTWKLHNWIAQYRRQVAKGESKHLYREMEAELAASKKEVEQLKQEVELLKKAAAYFAGLK